MSYSPHLLEGWNIVVVDDEEDSLLVADIILKEYGATVHTANNGKNGLEMIRKIRPHLVISDLSMPVMDGWGLIHEMQDDPACREIPVLALTAHAMTGDRERALAAGFYNYLTKPLNAATFINDLVRLLVDIPSLVHQLHLED